MPPSLPATRFYDGHYRDDLVLRSGSRVRVRPVLPCADASRTSFSTILRLAAQKLIQVRGRGS